MESDASTSSLAEQLPSRLVKPWRIRRYGRKEDLFRGKKSMLLPCQAFSVKVV